jgi:hypothetical protein
MARKVGELESAAIQLFRGMFLTMPAQYRDKPDPDDPLGMAWNSARMSVALASVELERLGDLLRAKAGITEPGPSAQFLAASLTDDDSPEPSDPEKQGENGGTDIGDEEIPYARACEPAGCDMIAGIGTADRTSAK